jgi:hypothetical protein
MKRRIHQILVGLSLLILIPGALLGLLLLIAAIGLGIQEGFRRTDAIAIPLLILPTVMGRWGVKLLIRLNGQFRGSLRRSLLGYHGLNFCYCGFWLVGEHGGGGGGSFQMFTMEAQIIGFSALGVPLLTALLLNPDLDLYQSKAEPDGG